MASTQPTHYPREFYETIRSGSRRSAEAIVPLVLDLTRPRRVVDVGCGTGTWLAVFREHGVGEVRGLDGAHVERRMLEIPEECFVPVDLTRPFRLDREFDLALSLEVAEHLPPASAEPFVDSLAALAPAILFSAAIPFQSGTHHVNEQWPEYWVERFARHGYAAIDCIRQRVWDNPDVEWWYAQNTLLFARPSVVAREPRLERERERTAMGQLSLVHPRKYLALLEWYRDH